MSKENSRMELSIDPNQKNLLRIFCQSIDSTVEYKSMEICNKTTVQEVIVKMIELLRSDNQISEFILCETIGRCMQLSARGSIRRKIAKIGQPFVFIEQNRRVLLNSDFILNVITFWKPSRNFSRRLELWYANTKCQMSIDQVTYENVDTDPMTTSTNGSVSSNLDIAPEDHYDKTTQTESSADYGRSTRGKRMKCPYLLTLKGDIKTLLISLGDYTEFGTPGSGAKIGLQRLQDYGNHTVCRFTKEKSLKKSTHSIVFDNIYNSIDLPITINGIQVMNKSELISEDIINIGDFYSFLFKDDSPIADDLDNESNFSIQSNSDKSNQSNKVGKSNSYSSSSDVDEHSNVIKRPLQQSKQNSTKINMVTLEKFDIALAQIMLHYVRDGMELQYAVGLTLYLLRFCRESPRCTLTISTIQDQMTKRFCRTLEEAFKDDNYLLATMKLTALGFQVWMIYNTDNSLKSTEENRFWLDHFECFTVESFGHISKYVCEKAKTMSLCFFLENPFVNSDLSEQNTVEDHFYTMENLLDFLAGVIEKIDKIGCSKTSEIFKVTLMSHITICLTDSIVSNLLSDMKSFTWNKGIFISTQVDKFEKWLEVESLFVIYEKDGFLHDFSQLISTRLEVLKPMDWNLIRHSYKKIHPTILRQFLLDTSSANYDSTPPQWHPPKEEMYNSNQNVSEVLSRYLQSKDQHTLFQPSIILQNESILINEVIRSPGFISICSVMDSELKTLKVNLQWTDLTMPKSLINFSHNRQYPVNEEKAHLALSSNSFSKKKSSIVKKLTRKKLDAVNDISAVTRPQLVKFDSNNSLNHLSKSLANLNEPGLRQKSATNYNPSSTTSSKVPTASNKSGYSSSSGSNVFLPIGPVHLRNTYNISSSSNHLNHPNFKSSIKPMQGYSQGNRQSEISLDTDNRIRIESNYSDVFADDADAIIEVTIKKSPEESYGITISDGMSTNKNRDGIFIFKVAKDSPAYNSNKLEPGDEILAINNYPVRRLNFTECLILMKKSISELKLSIWKSKSKNEPEVTVK